MIKGCPPKFIEHIKTIIKTNDVYIISGEGIQGTLELYKGKRTFRAIKMRLTKERCNGDRWAKAKVFSHITVDGCEAFINIETGGYC